MQSKGMSEMYKSFLKSALVLGLGLGVPSMVFAEQEAQKLVATDTVFILNSLLFLVGGFLVFWMAAVQKLLTTLGTSPAPCPPPTRPGEDSPTTLVSSSPRTS